MCGIYGTTIGFSKDIIIEKLARAGFRGPDYTGIYTDDKITFGHNRLSIIDLDSRSHQPFKYQELLIVYNGEVYNYNEIKKELIAEGFTFRTNSDTEVICAAYIKYGKECVSKFNGMFAFTIFDKKNNLLFGARDRLGQKPFYYSLKDGHFEFASQPQQIVIGNNYNIDDVAIAQYLQWKYVPAPRSIYQDIKKLRPGYYFEYDLSERQFKDWKYWDIDSNEFSFKGSSYTEAKQDLKDLLTDAVDKRMISDVPLGVFLSGGVDSSLVAAIAQKQSSNPVKTFSIKFSEADFDESQYARQVADVLNTDHTEIICDYNEGIPLVKDIATYYDEPFADASAIPSMLLAKHTRKHVTVALSGDAGDESFLGYGRYDTAYSKEKLFKILPYPLRKIFASALSLSPVERHKLIAKAGRVKDANELYYKQVSYINDLWLKDSSKGNNFAHMNLLNISTKNILERISDFDLKTYLVDDINVKVDRATMAFSLEARAPLEDYRVVEFARSLPTEFKYNQGNKKRILKDVLYDFVPAEIFNRPKAGFGMPLVHWFRGELKEFLLDNMTDSNLHKIPNINFNLIKSYLKEHISGERDRSTVLWSLLVLIIWMNNNSKL